MADREVAGPEEREGSGGTLSGIGRPEAGNPLGGSGTAAEAARPEAQSEGVNDPSSEITLRVNIARRYHARRARHFERLSRMATTLSLIGGTAFVSQLLAGNRDWELVIGGLIVVSSVLSLVFDWPGKASRHRNFYARYCQISARLNREGPDGLAAARNDEIEIESDEDVTLNILYLTVWNEEANAQGDRRRYRIWLWQRLLADFCDTWPAVWELDPEERPAKQG